MKKYLVFAAAASLFAACSNDDGAVAGPQQEAQQTAGEVAVAFDTYVNRATTRAGQVGEQTLTTIQTDKVGFGVFAYYTNADNYDQSFTPNFMYNQQVTYTPTTGPWVYSPIKYWPNEYGSNSSYGAASEDVDKVSFFAYAPYVSVNPTSGKVVDKATATYTENDGDITSGIVGMKNNSATGDPMVKYISTFYTDQQVDLTWGTVSSGQTWNLKNTNTALDPALDANKPWLNIQHPKETSSPTSTQRVKFNFLHALAALNVTVDTKANSKEALGAEASTKVFIRSVTFEGFDVKGALNLNNVEAEKALWYNFNCVDELNNGSEVTIKDGRKDGKEGLTEATKEYAVINPELVQSGTFDPDTTVTPKGVLGANANLFCTSAKATPANTDPIYVIPNTDKLKVTIEYDVLTKDPNLAGTLNDGVTKGSVVKNVITRYITSDGSNDASKALILTNGKKYLVRLHLGLNSVEFDAAVTPWGAVGTPDGQADLPHNN